MTEATSKRSYLVVFGYASVGILAIVMLVLSATNGEALTAVSIKLRPGATEQLDRSIPFVTKPGEELPDYQLSYRKDRRWILLGTRLNQSAADWIEFRVIDAPSLREVQAFRVVDVDKAVDDLLEELPVAGTEYDGEIFEYRLQTTRSFRAGMDWFASTALGKAIFTGIAVAVFVIVIGHVGPVLP